MLVKNIIYPWKIILILDGNIIQLMVVYTHLKKSSFFLTNMTGAPQGDKLGQMKPLTNRFSTLLTMLVQFYMAEYR